MKSRPLNFNDLIRDVYNRDIDEIELSAYNTYVADESSEVILDPYLDSDTNTKMIDRKLSVYCNDGQAIVDLNNLGSFGVIGITFDYTKNPPSPMKDTNGKYKVGKVFFNNIYFKNATNMTQIQDDDDKKYLIGGLFTIRNNYGPIYYRIGAPVVMFRNCAFSKCESFINAIIYIGTGEVYFWDCYFVKNNTKEEYIASDPRRFFKPTLIKTRYGISASKLSIKEIEGFLSTNMEVVLKKLNNTELIAHVVLTYIDSNDGIRIPLAEKQLFYSFDDHIATVWDETDENGRSVVLLRPDPTNKILKIRYNGDTIYPECEIEENISTLRGEKKVYAPYRTFWKRFQINLKGERRDGQFHNVPDEKVDVKIDDGELRSFTTNEYGTFNVDSAFDTYGKHTVRALFAGNDELDGDDLTYIFELGRDDTHINLVEMDEGYALGLYDSKDRPLANKKIYYKITKVPDTKIILFVTEDGYALQLLDSRNTPIANKRIYYSIHPASSTWTAFLTLKDSSNDWVAQLHVRDPTWTANLNVRDPTWTANLNVRDPTWTANLNVKDNTWIANVHVRDDT